MQMKCKLSHNESSSFTMGLITTKQSVKKSLQSVVSCLTPPHGQKYVAAKPEGKESKPGKTFTIFAGRKSLLYRLYSHGSTKVKANVYVNILTYCFRNANLLDLDITGLSTSQIHIIASHMEKSEKVKRLRISNIIQTRTKFFNLKKH